MNIKSNSKEGFSIIEVVLVLAIAGLIFLMVFIALPALQRNQRDTQRRNDVGTFISQVSSYSTNNNGKVPDSASDVESFSTGYLKMDSDLDKSEFKDPKEGENYNIEYTASQPSAVGDMSYMDGRICSGESMTATGATARSAAVVVKLEGSGYFCKSNQ